MTVAFVNDADVTNATAGTTVVVSRPASTANGHVLVAFIAMTNLATITPPAGWNLIGSQDASTSTRIVAYWKLASGEPASWTWTLGSSQRNWGWVGAYSGVKTTAPIHDSQGTADTTAGTAFALSPSVEITSGGAGVSAVSAIRTASGTGTTWTGSSTNERADLSTNAGSGTDIAGCVQETVYTGVPVGNHLPSWTASQSQTAGAMFAVTLQAEFSGPVAGALISRTVEVAWGADPDGDPDLWTWTPITEDVLDERGITVETGRDERAAIDQPAKPTQINLRLRNWRSTDGGITRTNEGQYTPDNPNGANYPNVVQYVPLRIVQPYGYVPTTVRYTVFVESWSPTWDASGRAAFVDVVAFGRLQRIRDEGRPIHSALYRRIVGFSDGTITPHAYYPCEDGSGSTRVASAFPGHQRLSVTGQVSFGGASDLAGSEALPMLAENGVIGGALGPGYVATGKWAAIVALKLPETPVAVESRLIAVRCTGTAMDWSLWIVPGSPDTLTIRAVTWGASLLDDPVAIVEADHYGQWRLYGIVVTQNGADVDYEGWSYGAEEGVGTTGTLAGRTIGSARTVRIVAFSALAGMGAGHIALYTDPAFTSFDLSFLAFTALDGNTGDAAHTRFLALCGQEGIEASASQITTFTDIGMGPQRPSALDILLQEAADTDHGIAHDARPDGNVYLTRRTALYNQDPAITLDGSLGQISTDVRPVFAGSGRITDSTVTRDGGSSARYVAAGVRGTKPDAKTLSLENDLHLYEIAGWRVALGNQPSMRYTSLPFNLRRNVTLVESWFNAGIGSRMQATNLPAAHGPSDPDGIIVGWTEVIRRDNWTVSPVLVSARPYDVPVIESGDDETAWRLDTGGSELASAANSSTTSLSVATTGDALWTTTDEPFDIDVGGERMTVTTVTGASSPQTFTVVRGVAGGATAKSHLAGAAVQLWRGRGVAL